MGLLEEYVNALQNVSWLLFLIIVVIICLLALLIDDKGKLRWEK